MARHKIDPAVSRKAYAAATKRLKDLNSGQFALLLDEEYAALGVESPKVRRERLAREAAEAARARREAQAAKKSKRLEEAAALLRAAGVEVVGLPFE